MIIEAMSSAPLRSHFAETLHQKSQRRRYVLLLQKREMKDYCVGLIKNVLFCLQFPPPPSIVSPPSQRKSRRSHSPGCIAATRQMQKMNGKKSGRREKHVADGRWPKTQRRDGYD